jgi:hypothetical protein
VFPGVRLPFARKRWFEEGSSFRQRLEQLLQHYRLPAKVDAFEWSGANSIFERYAAAKRLAESIDTSHASAPEGMHVVVGHSHGGSVAMLCLRHVKDEARKNLRVITLATPFMEVYTETMGGHRIQGLVGLALLFGLGFSMLVFVPVIHAALRALGFSPDAFTDTVNNALILLGTVSTMIVLYYAFVGRKLHERGARLIEATADGVANDHATDMLTLRGIDDEAGLALAAGAIGRRLSLYFFRIMGGLLALTFIALVYMHETGAGPESIRENIVQISYQVLWLGLPGIALFLILLAGCFNGVYGRELFFGSILFQVNTHSSPDQPGRIWVLTLRPSQEEKKGLRHALYDHDDAAPAIVNWIEDRVRPKQAA